MTDEQAIEVLCKWHEMQTLSWDGLQLAIRHAVTTLKLRDATMTDCALIDMLSLAWMLGRSSSAGDSRAEMMQDVDAILRKRAKGGDNK